jgi:hypothetical protein
MTVTLNNQLRKINKKLVKMLKDAVESGGTGDNN